MITQSEEGASGSFLLRGTGPGAHVTPHQQTVVPQAFGCQEQRGEEGRKQVHDMLRMVMVYYDARRRAISSSTINKLTG